MSNSDYDEEDEIVLPSNTLDLWAIGRDNENHNNRAFLAVDSIFIDFAVWYSRRLPKPLRRLVEFLFLSKAVMLFLILIYLNINFTRTPANCLDHVKDVWPRKGVLRVEIIQNSQRSHAEQTGTINELFTLEKSYEREYNYAKTYNPKNLRVSEPLTEELVEDKVQEMNTPKSDLFNYLLYTNQIDYEEMYTSETNYHTDSKSNVSIVEDSAQLHFTKHLYGSSSINNNEVVLYDSYIFEYSLEYGFLHLSPSARRQLGIPVMLVVLEPSRDKCFGDSVVQFILEYLLSYNDLIMSSFKSLVENQQNKGFLRNVITGEYSKIMNAWMTRTSYIASCLTTGLYAVTTLLLLMIIHHQLFVLIVDFAHLFHFYQLIYLPAMPILKIMLSLACFGILLSDFFNDFLTALYIIWVVLAAKLYHSLCSCCRITKKYWIKFFYLYHISFYIYYYMYNGQYGELALNCSWDLIKHSMIYFYHHYALPSVLQQVAEP